MAPTKGYAPVDAMELPRFSGLRTFMRLPHVTRLDDVDFAIVGVPFDTGATFRVGARFGPEAIRSSSVTLRPYNAALEIAIFEVSSGVDFGDLPVVPGYLPESHSRITEAAKPIVASPATPIFLGGDHSVSLPLLRAAHATRGPLALIHFDAHSDLWKGYYGGKDTHGTPFRRAVEEGLLDLEHSIQIGLRGPVYDAGDASISAELGFEVLTGPELHRQGVPSTIEQIRARVGDRPAYLTFDIDFVDPAYAPGTGTPEVAGFTGTESIELVRGLVGLDIRAYDVVEVMPAYDPAAITSLLAANLVYEFISLDAIARRKR
ncbi:MAG: agmatinase [Acidobacteriota bacterium]|nr:agmatinase [Acidobacteriota bacterium]